ncbi:MAG: hypothetical protein LUD12_14460 [Lachnospiraceae bacterium]|nr:hypothetical protein [Lachnospiraceae bacterium]
MCPQRVRARRTIRTADEEEQKRKSFRLTRKTGLRTAENRMEMQIVKWIVEGAVKGRFC